MLITVIVTYIDGMQSRLHILIRYDFLYMRASVEV